MEIVVCVKQVPDTTEIRIDPVTGTMQRQGVPSIINPYDTHAMEEALRLRERYGGHVTVVSMGPPQVKEDLKRCIALGADEAVLISDRAFAGADTLATSYVLAQAIARIGSERPVDLVLCGKQAIDGDTAQVGPGIAQRLGFEQLTYISKVESVDLERRAIRVQRHLEEGTEVVETRLPALLTVIKEINEIRFAGMPEVLRGARYQVSVWTKDDVPHQPELLGLKGSPTRVSKVFPPPLRTGGEIIPGAAENPEAAARALVEKLLARGLREKIGATA